MHLIRHQCLILVQIITSPRFLHIGFRYLIYYFLLFEKNMFPVIYVDGEALYLSQLCVDITPAYCASTQELMMQLMQHQLKKSRFRCKKNSWYFESNQNLQPPKYLINVIVNREGYVKNEVTEKKCSTHMDMDIGLASDKCSLHATMDHRGLDVFQSLYYRCQLLAKIIILQWRKKYLV